MYRTLAIITRMEQEAVGLFERGDGIKVRYIPSILSFVSNNTSKVCFWGYKEPENSLEYNLAIAQDFFQYSLNNQIFLITHSPAFIQLEEKGACLYRCFKKESDLLKQEILQLHKPILMTEGKTAVLILKEAWKRLYNYECPFEIKGCNSYSEENKISATGCYMLASTLKSWKYDFPNLLIGLFDNDSEGIKHFLLEQNFEYNKVKKT